MSKAYVFFADGFEEVEAITPVDYLRRAGVETVMVSIKDTKNVTGAKGIPMVADKLFSECDFSDADMLVLPGGMPGTKYLGEHQGLCDLLVKAAADDKTILGAICAGPTVLGKLGILKDKKATCYPGCEAQLTGAKVTDKRFVTDGRVVTSRGAGTAPYFAFALIEALCGEEKAMEIMREVVFTI